MSEETAPYLDKAIRFQAQIFKVQTVIDGGLRLTLDLGQVSPETIVALFDAKQPGVILEVAAIAVLSERKEDDKDGEMGKRSVWK